MPAARGTTSARPADWYSARRRRTVASSPTDGNVVEQVIRDSLEQLLRARARPRELDELAVAGVDEHLVVTGRGEIADEPAGEPAPFLVGRVDRGTQPHRRVGMIGGEAVGGSHGHHVEHHSVGASGDRHRLRAEGGDRDRRGRGRWLRQAEAVDTLAGEQCAHVGERPRRARRPRRTANVRAIGRPCRSTCRARRARVCPCRRRSAVRSRSAPASARSRRAGRARARSVPCDRR